MAYPSTSLPLHALKHLTPEHKQCFWEIAETFLDVMSGVPEKERQFQSTRVKQIISVAEAIQEHTNSVPFKRIGTVSFEPRWEDGRIKCTLPSYTGQIPVLDLRARLDDFLKHMKKKPKNWRMFAATLNRETNIITFWAQDVALKKRTMAKRNKLLRNGEAKKGKKKVKVVKTRIENLQAARKLSTEELTRLAQARGVSV